MYDSDKGQSWVLVLVRTLGYTQPMSVTLTGPDGTVVASGSTLLSPTS